MDNEPLDIQSNQNDEEEFLISIDDFHDLLMKQQEQM